MKRWALPVLAAAISSALTAQTTAPIRAVAIEQASTTLPRNTPVLLSLNETLNTKSSRTRAGNTFTLSVARNVLLGHYIVIPRGAKAVGTVTWRTRKGGFGKSGKMEISLDYIELGDQRIALEGRHREEGEGNSTATVGTFVFVSMLGSGLITGHSAEIPAGRELTAWTKEDVPVQLPVPAAGPLPPVPSGAILATPLPDAARMAGTRTRANSSAFGNRHVRCDTCR